MQLTKVIDDLTQWIEDNVCSQVLLLKPNDEKMSDGYTPEYIHPAAFSLYIPTQDCLPPEIDTKLPAVCVQLMDGNDDLSNNESNIHIRLAFAVWRPGKYIEVTSTGENGEEIHKISFQESYLYQRNKDIQKGADEIRLFFK